MKNKYLPYLAGITFSVIFGFSFLASNIALRYVKPLDLIAFRFLVAFGFIGLLRALKVVNLNFKGKDLRIVYLTGLSQPVLYFIFEVYGIKLLPSSEAGMMIALIPVVASIISVFYLGVKLNIKQFLFIILSFSGVFYINYMKRASGLDLNIIGLLCMGGAVISAAFYNNFSKRAQSSFTPLEITYKMMEMGAISFNVIALMMHLFEGDVSQYFVMFTNTRMYIPVVYLGVISSILAFFLVNYSLSKLTVSASAVFANLVTIVSIIAGVAILGESFTIHSLIGSIFILVGVYGVIKNEQN